MPQVVICKLLQPIVCTNLFFREVRLHVEVVDSGTGYMSAEEIEQVFTAFQGTLNRTIVSQSARLFFLRFMWMHMCECVDVC